MAPRGHENLICCAAIFPVLTGKCKVTLELSWQEAIALSPLGPARWALIAHPLDYLSRITGTFVYLKLHKVRIMKMDISCNPRGLSKGRGTLKKDYLTKVE